MPPITSFLTGGSSSQQRTHQPMSPISSYRTVEESAEEHDIGDEYLTEGYLTKKEQQQLLLDEEALRETLEEEARDEKEQEERMKEEHAHDELFRLEFGVQSNLESDNLLKFQQQLLLDEEALRETLEEEARDEKEQEERMKEEHAHDELFRLEFGVQSDSEYETD
ncbi:hypothetical protein Tco_0524211 [Tanacetum coccineum]